MITNPDPATFGEPSLRVVHAYWSERCTDASLPARRDIDPFALRRFLPRLMLVDVKKGPDFVYRLVGTEIVDDRGFEPTGKRVADVFPAHLAESVLAPYRLTHEHGQPVYDPQGWPDRRPCLNPDHTLFLPLASDGKRIDMILVYSVRPRGRTLGHDTGAGDRIATFNR